MLVDKYKTTVEQRGSGSDVQYLCYHAYLQLVDVQDGHIALEDVTEVRKADGALRIAPGPERLEVPLLSGVCFVYAHCAIREKSGRKSSTKMVAQ